MISFIKDFRYLKKNQYRLDKRKLENLQLNLLKQMYDFAISNSPFYRKLYEGKQFRDLNDFYQLPIIDKQIMMDNFSELNTVCLDKETLMEYAIAKERNKDYLGYYNGKYVIGLSSGTSGNKGLYITPKSLTKRLPAVFLARGGVSIGDLPLRILFCLRVFSQGFNNINAPLLKLHYSSTMTDPKETIDLINRKKINVLMAPPSFLRTILPLSDQIKVLLKKVITYAEVLSETDKEQFQKAFKAPVLEIYQASEGQIASCCKEGKLHINEDLVFVELYDQNHKRITEPGVVGYEMIVTNLVNTAQPLIRYRMNDMIVLDEPCKCGSSFRTIQKILGRSDDMLYFWDKKGKKRIVFPDLFARWIITESDDIREFQVIQEKVGEATVILDLLKEIDLIKLNQRLVRELNELGLHGRFDFVVQPIFLPENLNKYKRFINKINH